MKQHVNPKQLKEVSKEQISEWLSGTYLKRKNFYQYNCKKITIGKMMEMLHSECIMVRTYSNLNIAKVKVEFINNEERVFSSNELVDALWEAEKYVLENKN